jgi:hypothetical protein
LKVSVNVPPVGVPVMVSVWTSFCEAVPIRMTSSSTVGKGLVMSATSSRAAPLMKFFERSTP